MILFMNAHVFCQVINTRRQYGDLNFRRSCIIVTLLVLVDDLLFSLFRNGHLQIPEGGLLALHPAALNRFFLSFEQPQPDNTTSNI